MYSYPVYWESILQGRTKVEAYNEQCIEVVWYNQEQGSCVDSSYMVPYIITK